MAGIQYNASEFAKAVVLSSELVDGIKNSKAQILSILDILAAADPEMGIGGEVESIRASLSTFEEAALIVAANVRNAKILIEKTDAEVASQMKIDINNELDSLKTKDFNNLLDPDYQARIKKAQEEFNNLLAPYDYNAQLKNYENNKVRSTAGELWQKVVNGNYSYAGTAVPCNGNNIDCSSFVSWVLLNSGYKEFAGNQHVTQQFVNTNWNKKYGWEEIPVAAYEDVSAKLLPGDILVRDYGNNDGHMNITAYVKDGKVYAYDCGGENNWRSSKGEPVDKSKFAKTDRRPGKIIRISNLDVELNKDE